jgi:hypothetical protein
MEPIGIEKFKRPDEPVRCEECGDSIRADEPMVVFGNCAMTLAPTGEPVRLLVDPDTGGPYNPEMFAHQSCLDAQIAKWKN